LATRRTGVPPEFARAPLRVVTARHAATIYPHPNQQLARMAERGLLHRVADGFYVVVPLEHVGEIWLPELEAVAAGIGAAIHGPDHAILMGVSAARVLGAIPRAIATAIVAIPKQRAPIRLQDRDAAIRFVPRDTDRLDAERARTELGAALVTTPEQTVLDLAHRPTLGDTEVDVPAAIRTLYHRSDPQQLKILASKQRLKAALVRATATSEAV
jgi:hypothetical protein